MISDNTVSRWALPKFADTSTSVAKRFVHNILSRLQGVRLILEEAGEQIVFGEDEENAAIVARVCIHNTQVYKAILSNGSMGVAESYMRGEWTSANLTHVIRAFVINLRLLQNINSKSSFFAKQANNLFGFIRKNTLSQAKRNIVAHYDLSNEFFSLFLDKSMMYSAAIYPSQESDLACAAEYKLAHICERLQLTDKDHLVEIGSGWGGMAIYAAKHYGCKVTTTTISDAQYDLAKQRIESEGLSDKITLLNKDYRLLEGQYDKLVSIEMIEAVGHQFYSEYFEKCCSLLKPEGLMLIQAITIADQRYQESIKSMDFIRRYIFPGGCLPSVSVIADHVRDDTDLMIVGQEDITEHYARTLHDWRDAFFKQQDAVKKMGFDDTFVRMWDYYLCYCEGGFAERAIATSQFLMAKPAFKGLPVIQHG